MNKHRLQNEYDRIAHEMMERFNFSNKHQVCKIEKIILSKGINKRDDAKQSVEDLSNIAGQKAIAIKAKKSVSQFSVRQGQINGCKVTVRRLNMYYLLEKIINVGLVLNREFVGIKFKSFNIQKDNISLSFGIKDEKVFPEINATVMKKAGFNITIVTNAKDVKHAAFLINALGIPIKGGEF